MSAGELSILDSQKLKLRPDAARLPSRRAEVSGSAGISLLEHPCILAKSYIDNDHQETRKPSKARNYEGVGIVDMKGKWGEAGDFGRVGGKNIRLVLPHMEVNTEVRIVSMLPTPHSANTNYSIDRARKRNQFFKRSNARLSYLVPADTPE
jgi:hypothetical protein